MRIIVAWLASNLAFIAAWLAFIAAWLAFIAAIVLSRRADIASDRARAAINSAAQTAICESIRVQADVISLCKRFSIRDIIHNIRPLNAPKSANIPPNIDQTHSIFIRPPFRPEFSLFRNIEHLKRKVVT